MKDDDDYDDERKMQEMVKRFCVLRFVFNIVREGAMGSKFGRHEI